MLGKTIDDIRPPVPMRPDRDPLEAGNKFTHAARPRAQHARPAGLVSETYRARERQPEEAGA